MGKGLQYAIADFKSLWPLACTLPEGVGRGNYIFFELWRTAFNLLPDATATSLPEARVELLIVAEETYYDPDNPRLLIKGPAPDRVDISAPDEATHLTRNPSGSLLFDTRTAMKHLLKAVSEQE